MYDEAGGLLKVVIIHKSHGLQTRFKVQYVFPLAQKQIRFDPLCITVNIFTKLSVKTSVYFSKFLEVILSGQMVGPILGF
jgi:hypothetical protein